MRLLTASASLGALVLLCFSACSSPGSSTGGGGSGGSGEGGASSVSAGGETSASAGTGGSGDPTPGADALVVSFEKTHIYFAGEDNKRVVDANASFPAEGAYSQIILHLSLDCPDGGCDAWDRFATLGIVTSKGETPEQDEVIEIARYITPFKATAAWDIDVTDLRPLLSGDVTMRAFIDTWVGPGSPYGAGWLVTASFEMKGGIPAKIPVAVVPVWNRRQVVYGDPSKPIADSAAPQDIALSKGSSYALRSFVTGHGQGNADNCAEFCKREHTLMVGEAPHAEDIWRTDCATTGAPGQQGTWKYSRAGWCPGADVRPWVIDVTPDVAGAGSVKIAYAVEGYENTCRPGVTVCEGCTLGTGCEYDGGAHTEPNFQLSTMLIVYK